MITEQTNPDGLLRLMRSIAERVTDPDSERIDTGEAVELALAFKTLDISLVTEDVALPLSWRIRTAPEVASFIELHRKDHIDPKTGELNCTGLAEAAAAALDLHIPTPDLEVPEVLFELAATFNEDDG
jgi:hypothetical protein